MDLSKVTVDGKVDPTTPGTYPVTYSYTDAQGNKRSQTATITVVASKDSITIKGGDLIAGPSTKWTPADSFSGATDANGQPIDLTKITVTGHVDTTKPGTYPVTYSYTDGSGNIYTQTVTVTVTSGNDTTSNTNQGPKTTPSSSGQSTTQDSGTTPSNSGQSTTQKSETSSTIDSPSQVNTSDSLVNATTKATSVLPQTGNHQEKSTGQKALEIGLISATFGLILLKKRNKKNGID
ncbi:immunoglobulin-like domain-containing protein [Fructobacillus tropaeoli]|uniref:Beta-fructosidase n=1 Tax=Fructobacillus tropaeoli TaxID=709323 RepID=A0A3F3H983_9LACO|nr:immunoglobulin-like domain-containing protein [Fructobacillus tropaeoli]GAP04368.1 beta-fructosidase [Fructobacillus tropaeoli]